MNGLWTIQTARGFVLCVVLVTAQRNVPAADQPVLTELRSVCELSHKDAAQNLSVRVEGTVTFIEPEWKLMFIQTADQWTCVRIKTDTFPEMGQLVEVTGYTFPDKFRSSVAMEGLRVLGPGHLPEPVRVGPGADRRAIQYRWIEVNGTVVLVEPRKKWCRLYVASPQGVWFADVWTSAPMTATLKGRRVCLRGVLFSTESSPRDLTRLLVPERGIIDLGTAGGDDEFGEARQISSLSWHDVISGRRKTVRLLGLVTYRDRENRFFMTDETGHCLVTSKVQTTAVPGDIVDVRGLAVHDQLRPLVVEADVQRITAYELPRPIKVAAREAGKHLAGILEVEGAVVSVGSSENRPSLLLRDGDTIFRVRLGEGHDPSLLDLRPGGLVLATGACWTAPDPHVSFEILAQSTTVLSKASPRSGATSGFGYVTYLGVVLLVVVVVAAPIALWSVRKGARNQERHYELLNEQLSELSHVARLNMLSEMVGALAHELNQPLTSVLNYAAVANNLNRDAADQVPKLREVLERLADEAHRAGEIIRRLRALVRKKTPGKVATDVNQLVEDTVSLFRTQTVTAAGLVDLQFAENLPTITADPIQIQQVILNLLLNARHATEHVRGRVAKITVSSRATDDGVSVVVEDNGDGISTSDPDAVFEAFFTTKDEGIGLGLAICRKIVEMHDGKIAAERLTPFGTRMQFTLPAGKQP